MTKRSPPPVTDPILDTDSDGTPSLSWILFFNQIYSGDGGNAWKPNFVNLGVAGAAPTITGNFYKLSDKLAYFTIKIVPGTSTTATAGSTYIDNFPLKLSADGACLAVSGFVGSAAGQLDAATNRIYVPPWTAVTVPLTIVGIAELV